MVDGITIPHCAHGQARVLARLYVRSEPSKQSEQLGLLAPGELVDVWGVQDGWCIVQTVSGLTGWASLAYLEPVGEWNA